MRTIILLLAVSLCCSLRAQTPANWARIIPSPSAQLRGPSCISISPEGLIYISDTGHNRVIAVDSTGHLAAETGGFGDAHGQFRTPRTVVADRGNAVWVLDYNNRRIEKFSRSLEYQGTFTIMEPGDDTPHQPDALAISPQCDLYIYDRDGGRLVRYDPLFRRQAELGSGSGAQFISNIASMAFVPVHGLFWWSRGSEEISHTDVLLNPAASVKLSGPAEDVRLAPSDSCLLHGTAIGVFQRCALSAASDTLLTAGELAAMGVKHLAGLAISPDHVLYLLDDGTSAVFRVNLLRE